MKILTWSIINNEIDYLKDIIPYHLNWADGMYFLDTGSTDGSWEYLQEQSQISSNIYIEKYHLSFTPDFSVEWKEMENPFPEVEVRNYALSQAEKLNPAWLIQLDGDEIFVESTKYLIDFAENLNKSILSLSTINPVESLSRHPQEIRRNTGVPMGLTSIRLYDPHARIWKPELKIRFMNNPAFGGEKQYHCIPVKNNRHVYHALENLFLDSVAHYHLHWMYGKKVEAFCQKLGCSKQEYLSKQKINSLSSGLPKLFWKRREEWVNGI